MKTLGHLLSTPLPSADTPQTTSLQSTFSDQERDATAYFFLRLKAIYGAEYKRHFPDVESERISKREWARQIGQYSREKIDHMFGHVKSERMRGNDEYHTR